MGFRFFKRIQLAPGISINLSRSGVSASLGPRGAKVTLGPRGIRKTVGLPGTRNVLHDALFLEAEKGDAAPAA